MAFMMSPILSLAVAGFQGKDMAQAVGLANMIRQLGGSVGIALINAFLSNKNAEIRGNMVSYVNQYDERSTSRIAGLVQNFISKGFSKDQAEALAMKTMDGIVLKQQAIVSYDQGFLMVAIFILYSSCFSNSI